MAKVKLQQQNCNSKNLMSCGTGVTMIGFPNVPNYWLNQLSFRLRHVNRCYQTRAMSVITASLSTTEKKC